MYYTLESVKEMDKVDMAYDALVLMLGFYPDCELTKVEILNYNRVKYTLYNVKTMKSFTYAYPLGYQRFENINRLKTLIEFDFPDVPIERIIER